MSQKDLFGNVVETAPTKIQSRRNEPSTAEQSEGLAVAANSGEPISIETLSISPNYIATYETYLIRPNDNSVRTSEVNFLDRHHDCKMSQSAVKMIKKCTQVVCYLSRKAYFAENKQKALDEKKCGCTTKRYAEICQQAAADTKYQHLCTFVTLTLPSEQRHTDRELCKYVLNPFMVYARKFWKIKYYCWKKELQSNGNIHFHLIFDRTVPWQSIRGEWNKLLNQGKVKGCKTPFDYVQRYHDKWSAVHADGFNREYVTKYVADLPSTADAIKERIDIDENEFGRMLTNKEFDDLRHLTIEGIVSQYYKAYLKELKNEDGTFRSPDEMWWNPNSTDIKGINNPQQVSLYMSKYLAKDLDNNPALLDYQFDVDNFKHEMRDWQKIVREKEKSGDDFSDAFECWQKNKTALDEYREEHCPIKGRMWFKSQSLTVFMKGAKDFFDDDYYDELTDLQNYLHGEEKKINAKRLIIANNALKRGDTATYDKYIKPISLILCRYATNPDGTENPDKVVCKTLLISIFDLQRMKTDNNKPRFPKLALAWSRYIRKGLLENAQRETNAKRVAALKTIMYKMSKIY